MRKTAERSFAMLFRVAVSLSLAACTSGPGGSALAPCAPQPEAAVLARLEPVELPGGNAEQGASAFRKHCAQCHAPDPSARASRVYSNFPRLDCSDYLSRTPDEYLFTVISLGGEAVGRKRTMRAFAETLSKQQIADLIAYLRASAG